LLLESNRVGLELLLLALRLGEDDFNRFKALVVAWLRAEVATVSRGVAR
jgi:hypothetical protein